MIDDIKEKKEGLLPNLVKKAGEPGLLSAGIAEKYGGQDLHKVGSFLIMDKMAQTGSSFLTAHSV
jgi:alkylation response protein AidB-like acyl-CoA dehydrogenase